MEIPSSREIELAHRSTYQALTFGLEAAKLFYLANAHVCVADDVSGISEAVILYISGGLYALADGLAGISAKFFVIDSGTSM